MRIGSTDARGKNTSISIALVAGRGRDAVDLVPSSKDRTLTDVREHPRRHPPRLRRDGNPRGDSDPAVMRYLTGGAKDGDGVPRTR